MHYISVWRRALKRRVEERDGHAEEHAPQVQRETKFIIKAFRIRALCDIIKQIRNIGYYKGMCKYALRRYSFTDALRTLCTIYARGGWTAASLLHSAKY